VLGYFLTHCIFGCHLHGRLSCLIPSRPFVFLYIRLVIFSCSPLSLTTAMPMLVMTITSLICSYPLPTHCFLTHPNFYILSPSHFPCYYICVTKLTPSFLLSLSTSPMQPLAILTSCFCVIHPLGHDLIVRRERLATPVIKMTQDEYVTHNDLTAQRQPPAFQAKIT
jgi:hypothetical protein